MSDPATSQIGSLLVPATSVVVKPAKPVTLPQFAARIKTEAKEAEKGFHRFLLHAIEAGRYLCGAKALVPHGEWLTWFEANGFAFSERTAQRYMKAFEHRKELRMLIRRQLSDDDPLTLNKALALLSKTDDSETETAPASTNDARSDPAAAEDAESVSEDDTVQPNSSTIETSLSSVAVAEASEDDWLTPEYILKPVQAMLGVIDLDPASDGEGSRVVSEARYTKEDDGLHPDNAWHGRVFLNPPIAERLVDGFVGRLLREYRAKRVREAIILLPAVTDAPWFRELKPFIRAFLAKPKLCFDPNMPESLVAIYLGERHQPFFQQFEPVGDVYTLYGLRPSA